MSPPVSQEVSRPVSQVLSESSSESVSEGIKQKQFVQIAAAFVLNRFLFREKESCQVLPHNYEAKNY